MDFRDGGPMALLARAALTAALTALAVAVSATPSRAQSSGCADATPGYSRLVLAMEELRTYYRLSDVGPVACDLAGSADGSYNGGYVQGAPGALGADADTAVRLSGSGSIR